MNGAEQQSQQLKTCSVDGDNSKIQMWRTNTWAHEKILITFVGFSLIKYSDKVAANQLNLPLKPSKIIVKRNIFLGWRKRQSRFNSSNICFIAGTIVVFVFWICVIWKIFYDLNEIIDWKYDSECCPQSKS